jgi:hypothetical protein
MPPARNYGENPAGTLDAASELARLQACLAIQFRGKLPAHCTLLIDGNCACAGTNCSRIDLDADD